MHADMDIRVFMKLEGKMVELLVQLDPDQYAGKNALHQAQEGTIWYAESSAPFCKHLSGKLQGWGFAPNPYDSFMVHKDIDGSQCTILWHVDDLKISHVNLIVVTDIIKELETDFLVRKCP